MLTMMQKQLEIREMELAKIAKVNARANNARTLLSSPLTSVEPNQTILSQTSGTAGSSSSDADEFEGGFKTPAKISDGGKSPANDSVGMSKTLKTVTQRYHDYIASDQKKTPKQVQGEF